MSKKAIVPDANILIRAVVGMLGRLLADVIAFDYQTVCLDTALFMKSAHRIYETNGFSDRSAYEGVEVPSEFHSRWRFMERGL